MTPEVSIIIAMYNTEKYISECLDSLLCQTFQDYEIIIVDDCSTDNSCAIVENYVPYFGGKLRLIRSEKNSNSPGVPRNKGIELARGKYIWFVDSDDAVTETALEELYTIAEKFQAEIVHCEKYFVVDDKDFTTDENFLTADAFLKANFVSKPTFMTKNIDERLENFVYRKFEWSSCTNFIRRNFLMKHDIKFPPIKSCEDSVFTVYILCLAEKILRAPNVVYIYRQRKGSLSKYRYSSNKEIIKICCDKIFHEMVLLHKFFDKNKIFADEPVKKWLLFDFFINWHIGDISSVYNKVPIDEIDELIRREIKNFDDKVTLASIFFEYMSLFWMKISSLSKEIPKLKESIKKQRQVMNYQRVQVQNLKSVIKSTMPLP